MEKIKVRRQTKKHIYVHNSLSNAAYHFKQTVDDRVEKDELTGITYDILAVLIFLAFTVEAKINFLGYKLFPRWAERERDPFWKKLKRVMSHLDVQADFKTRPYSTITTLKDIRDSLAHGKPVHLELDEEAVIDADEATEMVYLRADWEKHCTEDFTQQAYDDVQEIWKQLLSAAKISLFDTLSGGEGSVTFIERYTDKET